jgi:hypothetical protein
MFNNNKDYCAHGTTMSKTIPFMWRHITHINESLDTTGLQEGTASVNEETNPEMAEFIKKR